MVIIMDNDIKDLIIKLDNYLNNRNFDINEKFLLVSDMYYIYQDCRLKDKDIDDIFIDLEGYTDIEDDIDDEIDDVEYQDTEPEPQPQPVAQPQPQPRPQPQSQPQISQLKQQLGKPIGIKKPQIKINQGEIDRGEF